METPADPTMPETHPVIDLALKAIIATSMMRKAEAAQHLATIMADHPQDLHRAVATWCEFAVHCLVNSGRDPKTVVDGMHDLDPRDDDKKWASAFLKSTIDHDRQAQRRAINVLQTCDGRAFATKIYSLMALCAAIATGVAIAAVADDEANADA